MFAGSTFSPNPRLGTGPVLAVGLVLALASPMAAQTPTPVSPGDRSGIRTVDGPCPAYSWTEVPNARRYELAVYDLGRPGDEPREISTQRVPGGATTWSPSLDLCLERGGRYAWSVRAVGADRQSEWSPPSLFKVADGPTEAEFEAALELVRSYLVAQGEDATVAARPEPANDAAAARDQPGSDGAPSQLAPPPPGTQLAIDGNVHATSFSGDGSTLSGVATHGQLATHVGNAAAHHTPTVDTNCNGATCDGSGFTNLNADSLISGTVAESRVDASIARDSEITSAIENLDCFGNEVLAGVFSGGNPHCVEAVLHNTHTIAGPGTAIGPLGPAGLYPSTLTVDFAPGNVIDVDVRLWLSHTRPDDLDILLVAPNGEAVMLMSDAGGAHELSGFQVNLSDNSSPLPDSGPIQSGSATVGYYEPTAFDPASDNFPAPAPPGPYGTSLSALAGIDQLGDWSLYIIDDESSEAGDLLSWAVIFTTLPASVSIPAAADLATHEADTSAHHAPPTSLPPSGAAGGGLAGTYPNPTLAADAVSSAEIVDSSITETDLAFDPATQAELDAVAPTGECEGFSVGGRRFIDRGDGTVRDCDTGKIWLRDAGCLGSWPWAAVGDTIFTKINELNLAIDFGCAEYTAGTYTDWEVPDIAILQGIVDSSISTNPRVYNGAGDAGWTPGNLFIAIQGTTYWSATAVDGLNANCVGMNNGGTFSCPKNTSRQLWAVRSEE